MSIVGHIAAEGARIEAPKVLSGVGNEASRLRDRGVVSSPSEVWGGAPAENDFCAFWGARTALFAIFVANFAFFWQISRLNHQRPA